jgi:hypothetical protein
LADPFKNLFANSRRERPHLLRCGINIRLQFDALAIRSSRLRNASTAFPQADRGIPTFRNFHHTFAPRS